VHSLAGSSTSRTFLGFTAAFGTFLPPQQGAAKPISPPPPPPPEKHKTSSYALHRARVPMKTYHFINLALRRCLVPLQSDTLQSALVRLAALDGQAAPPALPTVAPISIPLFSPRNDKIFPAIYFASFRISDPAFGSRSDLRYVPTLRTFLRLKCFFYSGREPRPRGTCRPKPVRFSPRFFPAIFLRDFSPRFFPAIFPRDSTG